MLDCEDIATVQQKNIGMDDYSCQIYCGDGETGDCVNHECACNTGWSGPTCKAAINKSPNATIYNTCCDVSEEGSCSHINVGSQGFLSNSTYRCFLDNVSGGTLETTGRYVYPYQLTCSYLVPLTPGRYLISISMDNKERGSPANFTVYDSMCMFCSGENGSSLMEEKCYIESSCWNANDVNSLNPASTCDPSYDQYNWSVTTNAPLSTTTNMPITTTTSTPTTTTTSTPTTTTTSTPTTTTTSTPTTTTASTPLRTTANMIISTTTNKASSITTTIPTTESTRAIYNVTSTSSTVMSTTRSPTISTDLCRQTGCEHSCEADGSDRIVCTCDYGYRLVDDETSCIDLNECNYQNGGCDDTCVNTAGSFHCACSMGTVGSDGKSCIDFLRCDQCSHHCDDSSPPKCACPLGLMIASDEKTCIDINECRNNNGGCEETCTNLDGSHQCTCDVECRRGYIQVDYKCIWRCEIDNGGCSHICNEDGCACPGRGQLAEDGKTCKNVCEEDNGGCDHNCHTSESFLPTCSCNDRFFLQSDNRSCAEIPPQDPCLINNGGCGRAECQASAGGSTNCFCSGKLVLMVINGSQDCLNECPEGLVMNTMTGVCEDVDECHLNLDGCEDICNNTHGGFTCSCRPPFKLDTNGKNCTEQDRCSIDNGGCEHLCSLINNVEYECLCREGYVLDVDLHSCLTRCEVGNGGCGRRSICTMVGTTAQCTCPPGAFFDNSCNDCSDVCDDEKHNSCGDKKCSSANAIVDKPYTCLCHHGEELISNSCVDGCTIESKHGCEKHCVNHWNGVYSCGCDATDSLNEDGKTCSDKDECLEGMHSCSDTCVNDAPGYHCECPNHLRLDVDGLTCIDYDPCYKCPHLCELDRAANAYRCECREGHRLAADKRTCLDLDECDEDNGGCDHICTNKDQGYECHCNPGFELDVDGKTCVDKRECHQDNGGCSHRCVEEEGGFHCECHDGYFLEADNRSCSDIPDCKTNRGGCSDICIETPGSYKCACGAGYVLGDDAKTCKDVNECLENPCDQTCENTDGHYECSCQEGFQLSLDKRSCIDKRT
ncbi:fibrillin-1-like isoform X2 [Watersipora subatra]|uniref:fibrillin-1-like isoform X2 n=1 Tax=Watersipora subatra TaxID=2589382 RepID=UPI00355C29BA